MTRNTNETRTLFDNWAGSYDQDLETPNGILEGYDSSLASAFELCKTFENMKILDVGIGTGKFAQLFEGSGVNISGIDVSTEMLKQCKKVHPDYELKTGAFQNVNYDEGSFDGVVSSFCFHEVPIVERLTACKEVYRVVRKGGYACIVDIMFASVMATNEARSRMNRYWDDSEDYALIGELDEQLYDVGFHSVKWVQTSPLHWACLAYK